MTKCYTAINESINVRSQKCLNQVFLSHVYLRTLADSAENQLGPVSQTISTAGAVCVNLKSTSNSSATSSSRGKTRVGSHKYCTTLLPQLMGSIDLFDTM